MYLFFDTETTGLSNRNAPDNDPSQPRIVQFAAILTTNEGRTVEEINMLLNPTLEGEAPFQIKPEVEAVHGIQSAFANTYGWPQKAAVRYFNTRTARQGGVTVVAHNLTYDLKMLDYAAARSGMVITPRKGIDTMKVALPVVKCPPTERMIAAGRTGFKNPTLTETMQCLFGRGLDGAHDALVDTRACRDIFFALKEQGHVKEEAA